MPEMDGFEAVTTIRTGEFRLGAHIPIIALTAHAMKGDRERCLKSGFDVYLTKPIRLQELFEAIEHVAPASTGKSPAPTISRMGRRRRPCGLEGDRWRSWFTR